MQQIAMENNLAETAFFVKDRDHFDIRWFTPKIEVDLCGHATLATAYVIFNFERFSDPVIRFGSRSGILRVLKDADVLTLDFPADKPVKRPVSIAPGRYGFEATRSLPRKNRLHACLL